MLRLGSMLNIQKDAWFWGQDGGTAVTALSLAGALAAGLCLCLCARVLTNTCVFYCGQMDPMGMSQQPLDLHVSFDGMKRFRSGNRPGILLFLLAFLCSA